MRYLHWLLAFVPICVFAQWAVYATKRDARSHTAMALGLVGVIDHPLDLRAGTGAVAAVEQELGSVGERVLDRVEPVRARPAVDCTRGIRHARIC